MGGSGVGNVIAPCGLGLTAALLRKAQCANWLWPVPWMGISDPLPLWQKQGVLFTQSLGAGGTWAAAEGQSCTGVLRYLHLKVWVEKQDLCAVASEEKAERNILLTQNMGRNLISFIRLYKDMSPIVWTLENVQQQEYFDPGLYASMAWGIHEGLSPQPVRGVDFGGHSAVCTGVICLKGSHCWLALAITEVRLRPPVSKMSEEHPGSVLLVCLWVYKCVCTWKCMDKISLRGSYALGSVIGSDTVVSKERCGFTSAGDLARGIVTEAFIKKKNYFKEEINFLCLKSTERGQLHIFRFQTNIIPHFWVKCQCCFSEAGSISLVFL